MLSQGPPNGPQGAEGRLVLTVRAKSSGQGTIEMTCTTMGGNTAATLEWPSNDPPSSLAQAVVGAVESSGFDCKIKPLWPCHLSLITQDGAKLDLGREFHTQLGLEPASAVASSEAPLATSEEGQESQGRPDKRQRTA